MSKFDENSTAEFVSAVEAAMSAMTVIDVFFEDCNATTPRQEAKLLGMLVSCCCAMVVERYGGLEAMSGMLDAVHAQIVQGYEEQQHLRAANPGAGAMQ